MLADTLRQDRLGAYGGLARTPVFDRLAAEGLLFEQAWSTAPWTKPSIATLFTGLYPSQHGVLSPPTVDDAEVGAVSDALGDAHETLAEALAAAGWHTAGIVSNPWLGAALGFAQGFAHWDERLADNATPGPLVTRAGLAWLRALPDDGRPFFLYLHYMDPHEPYRKVPEAAFESRREAIEADARPVPDGAAPRIARLAVDPWGQQLSQRGVPANLALGELAYDQGVEAFDRALGTLVAGLAELPRADDALLVVTSDHGQALFQRGWGGHGRGLYADETAIPLLLHGSRVPAQRVAACPVGGVDLRSTLCDLLGVECAGPDEGRSLLREGAAPRIVLSEGVRRDPTRRAARDARHTLIGAYAEHAPRLYDHVRDPAESNDLAATPADPASETSARERLEAALATGIAPLGLEAPERVPLDADARRRLEALGYLDAEPGR